MLTFAICLGFVLVAFVAGDYRGWQQGHDFARDIWKRHADYHAADADWWRAAAIAAAEKRAPAPATPTSAAADKEET